MQLPQGSVSPDGRLWCETEGAAPPTSPPPCGCWLRGRGGWLADVGVGDVALVGLPPLFGGVGDALLHGGRDVAVDAAYAGQPVAEPFGLGDLGDVVFDE